MSKAKIITVSIEATDTGLLRATSDDMLSLHVVAQDAESLKELAKEMIADLYEAQGELVSVYETESRSSTGTPPWVVVPYRASTPVC